MTVALSLGGVADTAQIALTGIALLAFGGAVWQTILVRRSAREALTYNYFPRFEAAEIRSSLVKLLELKGDSDEERRKHFGELSGAEQLEVLLILNLCEELGGVYMHGMVEKDLVRRSFGHTAKLLWEQCRWLVEPAREEDPDYYRDWQDMLIDMGHLQTSAPQS